MSDESKTYAQGLFDARVIVVEEILESLDRRLRLELIARLLDRFPLD